MVLSKMNRLPQPLLSSLSNRLSMVLMVDEVFHQSLMANIVPPETDYKYHKEEGI